MTINLQPQPDQCVVLQELQLQVDREASSAKTERKKRETAERASKQAVEDKASIVSTLAEHGQQVAQLQAAARRQERLADERLLRAEHQIAAMAQARRELDNKVRHICSNIWPAIWLLSAKMAGIFHLNAVQSGCGAQCGLSDDLLCYILCNVVLCLYEVCTSNAC